MVSITPPADDAGMQSLKRDNAHSGETPEVAATSAYPVVMEMPERPATVPQRRPVPGPLLPTERRRGERRKNERRQQRQNVLLDTRSKSERRKLFRRRSDILASQQPKLSRQESSPPEPAIIGVDVTT